MEDGVLFELAEDGKEIVNIPVLREHFFEEGRLSEDQILKILKMGSDVLRPNPNVIQVDAPLTSTRSVSYLI